MRILGIDPGLHRIGFGLIELAGSRRYHAKDWGVLTTDKADSEAQRLLDIYEGMTELIKALSPDMVAIERLFYFRNATTMGPVSQARGVIILTLQQAGLRYAEYTPMQIKQNLTGYGKASKQDVQAMIQQVFELDTIPRPDDAADGLAIALSYAFELGGTPSGMMPSGV